VKQFVAKLAKSFGIHTCRAESLGDFRYKSRANRARLVPRHPPFDNLATNAFVAMPSDSARKETVQSSVEGRWRDSFFWDVDFLSRSRRSMEPLVRRVAFL
jgi:hypothetical protein